MVLQLGNASLLEIVALALSLIMIIVVGRDLLSTSDAADLVFGDDRANAYERKAARDAVRREALRLVTFVAFGGAAAIGMFQPSGENDALSIAFWSLLLVAFASKVANSYLDTRH